MSGPLNTKVPVAAVVVFSAAAACQWNACLIVQGDDFNSSITHPEQPPKGLQLDNPPVSTYINQVITIIMCLGKSPTSSKHFSASTRQVHTTPYKQYLMNAPS